MDCYNEKLTSQDVMKLKKELRGGRIMGAFVALAGVVVVLVGWLMHMGSAETRLLVGVIIGLLAILICWMANRKIRKDIASGEKLIMPKKVTDLTEEPMTLAWDVTKQASKKRGSLYFVHTGKMQFSISKEKYENMKVGGMCELCFGEKSQILLEVRIKR